MGRRPRNNAMSSLTDALTRQFGESSRGLVETHVNGHLGSSKGQIGRQDLDAIEKGILQSMREQRGSTKSMNLSRSAPSIGSATGRSGMSNAGATGAFPPSTPARATPFKLPLGTTNPGTVARSNSAGSLTTAPKLKPRRPAPYGLSITKGSEFIDESARSGVKLLPRYPVPMPPKLKPMDHWDLMVAFDSHKYRTEEKALHQTGAYAAQMSFKKTLDDQMLEVQENWDNEAQGKREEALLMLAQVEENKIYHEEEQAIVDRKRDEQGKVNSSMLGGIQREREKAAARKAKECEEVTAWLEAERQQKEEDEREQRIQYALKCAAAKKSLEENRAERAERLRLEQENEKRLMKIRDQIADEKEAAKQKAFQDRKDHIDRVAGTLGAAVADRDAKDAADLEARIKAVQEASNRKAMEDARRKQDTHDRLTREMVATLDDQMAARGRDDVEVKAADKRQMLIYAKEHEDSKRAEAEKLEKRRLARENQDKELIGQIRINAVIHPQHIMMTPRNRKTELGYNKAIFEQMGREGFMTDQIATLRAKPQKDHHPEGKLCPFPTIPRYTGEIHPIELEMPDV